jgi:hypothetical protein
MPTHPFELRRFEVLNTTGVAALRTMLISRCPGL